MEYRKRNLADPVETLNLEELHSLITYAQTLTKASQRIREELESRRTGIQATREESENLRKKLQQLRTELTLSLIESYKLLFNIYWNCNVR